MADLNQIIAKFTSGLFGLYKVAEEEIGKQGVERPSWLQSYLIFCALEMCRDLIGDQTEHVYCRFSFGAKSPGNEADLERFLNKFRRLNDAVKLRPDQLKEHLVDFSFSMGTVEQGWGGKDLPANVKFRLLLAAESEINENFGRNVLEDGLKLLDTVASVKVLIFPSCSGSDRTKEKHEQRLTKLFNAHDPEGHQDGCQWLLFGIPKFDDWLNNGGAPSKLARQVYTLAPRMAGQSYALREKSGLWTDEVPVLP